MHSLNAEALCNEGDKLSRSLTPIWLTIGYTLFCTVSASSSSPSEISAQRRDSLVSLLIGTLEQQLANVLSQNQPPAPPQDSQPTPPESQPAQEVISSLRKCFI